MFRIIDDDNSNSVELSEFMKVCKEYKLTWTQEQCAVVFNYFDRDRSGRISYDELLYGIRGELNDRRKQMVLLAFEVGNHCTDISFAVSNTNVLPIRLWTRTNRDLWRPVI